jgi:hypothetical protein
MTDKTASAGVAAVASGVPATRLDPNDPIPAAFAVVDARLDWVAECDQLDESASAALDKAKLQLDGAKLAVAQAKRTREDRAALLAEAKADLQAALDADPDTAAAIKAQRSRSQEQEMAALTARLAKLKGGN